MQLNNQTARALRFAARLTDRAVKGEDLGDSVTVDTIWSGANVGKTEVTLHLWTVPAQYDNSMADRLLAVRRTLGGKFDKNDPADSPYDSDYARLSRIEEDFVITLLTNRSLTCERKQVSVEVVHHEAVAAYDEEVPRFEWDCSPLNDVVETVKATRR